jgi:hypothetical protein
LTIIRFPQSSTDREGINDVADVIIKRFKNSLFFSPYGVTIIASQQQGHVIMQMTGAMTINAIEGHPAPAKEPLDLRTSFSLAESSGFWIAWAYAADDAHVEAIRQAKLGFADHPPH